MVCNGDLVTIKMETADVLKISIKILNLEINILAIHRLHLHSIESFTNELDTILDKYKIIDNRGDCHMQ